MSIRKRIGLAVAVGVLATAGLMIRFSSERIALCWGIHRLASNPYFEKNLAMVPKEISLDQYAKTGAEMATIRVEPAIFSLPKADDAQSSMPEKLHGVSMIKSQNYSLIMLKARDPNSDNEKGKMIDTLIKDPGKRANIQKQEDEIRNLVGNLNSFEYQAAVARTTPKSLIHLLFIPLPDLKRQVILTAAKGIETEHSEIDIFQTDHVKGLLFKDFSAKNQLQARVASKDRSLVQIIFFILEKDADPTPFYQMLATLKYSDDGATSGSARMGN